MREWVYLGGNRERMGGEADLGYSIAALEGGVFLAVGNLDSHALSAERSRIGAKYDD